jgi:hypothetical protein
MFVQRLVGIALLPSQPLVHVALPTVDRFVIRGEDRARGARAPTFLIKYRHIWIILVSFLLVLGVKEPVNIICNAKIKWLHGEIQ